MIAGEFAVLEPNYKLVVMAVDRFVYTTLNEASEYTITLENFSLDNLRWQYKDGHAFIESKDERVLYTSNALDVACRYLDELNIPIKPMHIAIRSELDDASGRKYGLGSSAAVVTSIISAILTAYLPHPPEPMLVFKLAAITHVNTQGNGSGADVAASAYGGFIEYTSFQAEWLREANRTTQSLIELVNMNWEYLSIKPFRLPEHAHMAIGWTGTPASTGQLVKNILKLKVTDLEAYEQFLLDSKTAVAQFIQGAKVNDIPLMQAGIKKNRHALARVGMEAGVDIETDVLKTLCDIAERCGGAGKSSGAGGGDCGIAVMTTHDQVDRLEERWTSVGIEPLSLRMAPQGAAVTKDCNEN